MFRGVLSILCCTLQKQGSSELTQFKGQNTRLCMTACATTELSTAHSAGNGPCMRLCIMSLQPSCCRLQVAQVIQLNLCLHCSEVVLSRLKHCQTALTQYFQIAVLAKQAMASMMQASKWPQQKECRKLHASCT